MNLSRRDRHAIRIGSRRTAIGALAAFLVISASVVGLASVQRESTGAAETPVTIAAAGDLGGSANEIRPVANLMDGMTKTPGDRILLLGDLVYSDGDPSDYASWFNDVYGPLKAKTIATPGNHDAHTAGIAGFFGYYPTTIPHAFDLANGWTVITVNTEVSHDAGSTMEQQIKALANDAKARGRHIIAITHHPRYTGGSSHGDDSGGDTIFRDLNAAKADLYLAGHQHLFERYQPSTGGGVFGSDGVRSFTAGTGGNGLYSCRAHTGRETCIDNAHGALRLKLFSDHYDWAFVNTGGQTLDAGSAATRTGGTTSSTTSSSSSTTSFSTSSSTSTSTSSIPTTTTTVPSGSCTQHSGIEFVPASYLHVISSGCWQGGAAWATNPYTASWDTFHRSAVFIVRGPVTLRDTMAVNFGDGYHVESGNGFLFDRAHAAYLHDDAIENDRHQSGTVRDGTFGSYVSYSDSGEFTDNGSGRAVLLARNIFLLNPIPAPYKGAAPGSGPWFKTDQYSATVSLIGNRFIAKQVPNHGDLNPPDHVGLCSGNTIEWRGTAPFPSSAKAAWLSKCPGTVFIGA